MIPPSSSGKTSAASVVARLRNIARERGLSVEATRDHFVREAFLRRLVASPFAEDFILKGSVLLLAWFREFHRPTMDADFLVRKPMSSGDLRAALMTIIAIPQDDQVLFDAQSLRMDAMQEDRTMVGYRISIAGGLGAGSLLFRADIGFSDVVTPQPGMVSLDGLMAGSITLLGSTIVTVIAEKYDARSFRPNDLPPEKLTDGGRGGPKGPSLPPSIKGIPVRITTAARTVAECLRHLKKMGLSQFQEILWTACRRKSATADDMMRYASALGGFPREDHLFGYGSGGLMSESHDHQIQADANRDRPISRPKVFPSPTSPESELERLRNVAHGEKILSGDLMKVYGTERAEGRMAVKKGGAGTIANKQLNLPGALPHNRNLWKYNALLYFERENHCQYQASRDGRAVAPRAKRSRSLVRSSTGGDLEQRR